MSQPQKQLVYRYTIDGRSWEIDWWDLEVDEFILMTKATGYRYPVLAFEHENGDFAAVKALVWIARRRAGESDLQFDDVQFKLRNFKREVVRTPEAPPDPPAPAAPVTASTRPRTSPKRPTSSSR